MLTVSVWPINVYYLLPLLSRPIGSQFFVFVFAVLVAETHIKCQIIIPNCFVVFIHAYRNVCVIWSDEFFSSSTFVSIKHERKLNCWSPLNLMTLCGMWKIKSDAKWIIIVCYREIPMRSYHVDEHLTNATAGNSWSRKKKYVPNHCATTLVIIIIVKSLRLGIVWYVIVICTFLSTVTHRLCGVIKMRCQKCIKLSPTNEIFQRTQQFATW